MILPSGSSYVDNAYFRSTGKEDKARSDFKNYPVKVMGLPIDWIIKFQEKNSNGKKFLQAILSTENLEVYDC